jgi:uncharacterized protein
MSAFSGLSASDRYATSCRRVLLACAVVACLLAPFPAWSQSFDCQKAQDPVDRAICASPRLRQLDAQLAAAYAAALTREAVQADGIRQAQRTWAKSRATCIPGANPPADAGARAEQCLAAAYANRLAALAPPQPTTAATTPQPAATPAPRSTPAAATPAPPSPQSPTQTGTPTVAASPAPNSPAPPRPATGLPAIPAGAATLERDHFPSAGETDILLHVTTPGRFAIRADSPTGTALQLVDMLTGPGDRAGWPGKQDGRIDALLDTGTYKLRAFGDPAASGDTSLTVTAFTEAAPAQIAPGYQPVASVLRDLQLQSFWLVVSDAVAITRIEAAGRSLAALKLWRDGRDLVAVTERTDSIAPTPAHPMTDIQLSGKLPPGTYLVTAYGGPELPWADGVPDEPLFLRTGRSADLLAGGASSQIGVFGTEVFDAPPDAARVLLILPQPAEAHLSARIAGADSADATVDTAKTDRARAALLDLPGHPGQQRFVELAASAGQSFALRPLAAASAWPEKPGRYWLGVAEPANGGDEAPAAAILTRTRLDASGAPEPTRTVLAAPGVPVIGPGKAWRSRFNLRGGVSLVFHVSAVVTVAVHAEGPPVTARITTLEGAVMNALGDGRVSSNWALSPGWYALGLTAKPDAVGILDLTLGPPGLIPPAPDQPGPEAPVLPLGEQSFDAQSRLAMLANRVPDGAASLLIRAAPIELADGPLVQTQAAGQAFSVAVHTRRAGILVVRDVASAALLEAHAVDADATTTIALTGTNDARTLAVALLPPPSSAAPEPAPAADLVPLRDGQPAFLDLARDGQASFDLTVGQGGLYRVETIGRLKTEGNIGTAFIPILDQASANGIGNNMLLQRYLRAGRYRLGVTARESAGRLGVSASATPLAEGAELLPQGSVRATLPPGHGVAFPIRIAVAGRYHLDLLGDGRVFSARLEDADGWPLRAAGDLSSVDQDFAAGRYRLIVQPESVQARAVGRLRRIEPAVALSNHGPHPLPFGQPQSLEWREPPGRDDPRTPDTWTFALSGPAKITLRIDGDGMAASLLDAQADAGGPVLGRLMAGTPLIADLPAGRYRVVASALGRNDRLAYTITLHSDELQPDAPRAVALPTTQSFAIAEARVVTVTSFGGVPLRAELRDAAGRVLARAAGRTDDWNIALSRFLPAGRYQLALARLVPPAGHATSESGNDAQDTGSNDNGSGNDSTAANDNGAAADQPPDQPTADNSDQSASDQGNTQDQSSNAQDQGSNAQDQSSNAQDQSSNEASAQSEAEKPPARTEVTLFLPADRPELPLPADGTMVLEAGGIQHVTLPAAPAGSLLVAAAEAPVELILALEHRFADGTWHTVGQSQGLAPILGVPVGDGTTAWRASVWTVDGGTVPIHFAARAATAKPAVIASGSLAPMPLEPVALGGITQHWNVAQVADPGAAMLRLTGPISGLLTASAPGRPTVPPAGGTIVAQSDAVWLLSPEPTSPAVSVVRAGPGTELAIGVPAGGQANLPISEPAASTLCAYTAASGLGQPGLEAGRGMGVAQGSAFALCGAAALRAWNAGGDDALRIRLRRHDLVLQPQVAVDQAFAGTVPPHSALRLSLPAGEKRLDVSLATGGALVVGAQNADAVTAWAGGAALSRSLTGGWTDALLANTTNDPAPATLTVTSVSQPEALASGGMFRRFFGAGGSFVVPVTAKAGQRLMLAGAAAASVQRSDGQVRSGRAVPLDGPATVVVTHDAGPLALWIEGAGASPWPDARPRDVKLAQRLTLEGETMALRLSPGAPVLLRLASTAPVILAVGADPPVLFDKGVALARYLPAGDTVLKLLSPQDGPLSGALELSGSPVTEVGEGLGAPVAIAPGGAAVFGFTVAAAGPVGLGVRADPDRVAVRLLDEQGRTLERGVSMLRQLAPGHYLLEASVPPDAPTTVARPAVLGIVPHRNPPPTDVVRGLLIAAGFAPPG